MRLRHLALALLSAVAVAGCGSSSPGAKINPSVLEELSYFPSGTPFVLSIATDPNSTAVKHAQQLEGQLPIAALGQTALTSRLSQLGINYQTDVRPLFGNPLTVGAVTAALSGASANSFLLVWITKDQDKLKALLRKIGGAGLQSTGTHDGATMYSAGTASLAISGATLLVSGSSASLTQALDRHAHGGGVSASEYQRQTAGLPTDVLAEAAGDLRGALSSSRAAKARNVPWVAALRGYGVAIDAAPSNLTMRFHLDTTGAKLTAAELPLAGGSATPSFAGSFPISVGIHDPSQIVAFAENAAQSSNPSGYADFLQRQASVQTKTGVNVTDFLKLFTGDLVLGSDTHRTLARVAVSNPATAQQDLVKLTSTPSALFSRGERVTPLPGGLYAIHQGRQTINVGVIGGQLVAGKASPAQLQAFAATPTTPASSSHGTLAFRIDLGQLVRSRVKRAPPQIVQNLLNQLSYLTGWGASSPSGTDGSATLNLK